jgi:hypothetical protein
MTKKLTIAGLLTGAVGIALLWAGGIPFPIYPPPGILILTAGAVFVSLVKLRWAPAVGSALGLFVLGGFFLSDGMDNLTGVHGATVSIGSGIQLLGVATAFVAGVLATRQSYQRVRG